MLKPDADGFVNVTWPSKNIPHGGIFHTRVAEPTEKQQQLLKVLLEESKLTIAQRQKTALKLREYDEKKTDSELLVRMPLVRPQTSRRRSLSTIRESGIFDRDFSYRPLKRGEDREKMKERLANTMAYGDDQEQRPPPPPPMIKKPQPKLPTSKEIWNELITQIRERTEWLAEMEYLGQAGPHRDIIKDQIAERMRALDALGIDDSECSTPKSAASGFTLRYREPEPDGQRRNSSVPSSRSDKGEKKRSGRSTFRDRDKEENVGEKKRSGRSTVRARDKEENVSEKKRSARSTFRDRDKEENVGEKKRSGRSTVRARDKDENVSSYSQLTPLQYSPRRRQ